jgi:hypothetical protein
MPTVGKRLSFKPNHYSKKLDEINTIKIRAHEITINKGNTQQTLDTNKLKDACKILRKHWNEKLKDLSTEAKTAFETLSLHISSLYDTDAYPIVYDIVQNSCEDLIKNGEIVAGTVSGYIGGCSIEKHFKSQPGCGVTCAGAMPPLDKPEICQYPVMLATLNANGYSFQLLQDHVDRSSTIIYCSLKEEKHPQLSQEEKQALKDFNIRRVWVIMFDGNKYTNVTESFVDIDSLPSRGIEIINNENLRGGALDDQQQTVEPRQSSFALVSVLLILIFIGFFLAIKYSQNMSFL